MAKLHFRYGTMGSSKSAQVLMTRFNYMERGRRVWLIKPATDTRDGADVVRSRIGLEEGADVMVPEADILAKFLEQEERPDVVIADECQFFTESQILQMKKIVAYHDVPVLCYGLRTDFRCKLFPGSRALFELADEIEEIRSICKCGAKASVNARLAADGRALLRGAQVELGGNDRYESMCWKCYRIAAGCSEED